jgi:hypothetical protein
MVKPPPLDLVVEPCHTGTIAAVERRERERIMREGGRNDSPLDRAKQQTLAEDLEGSPLRGQPLRRRLRNFRPAADSYIASLGGPRPYMQRLREIEVRLALHQRQLQLAWDELRAESGEEPTFARRWRKLAERWRFDEVNDLIDRHNRYFPAEARLPMDPRTGDFVLLQGKRYEREPLDAAWILERFPAESDRAA